MHLRRRMHHPRLYQDKRNALQLGAQLDAPVLNMGGDVAPTPLKILPPSFGAAEVGRQQAVRGPATADRVIARGFDSAVPLIGVAGAKGRGVRRGNRDCGGGDEGAPVCFCRGNWVRFPVNVEHCLMRWRRRLYATGARGVFTAEVLSRTEF
jgi:hypothetical protein